MSKMQTLLVGKGALALGCAEILIAKGCGISAIVSSDKDVRTWAVKAGIKYYEDSQLPDLASHIDGFDILFSIGNFNLIPDSLLQCARRMSINYHYGPLPEYAGLHVPSWAIYNQETTYDVCWHKIDGAVDSGNILKRIPIEISASDTALKLELKCSEKALDGFGRFVDELESGQQTEVPQDLSKRQYYSKNTQLPAEGFIDWNTDANAISAMVRATDYGPFECPLVWAKIVVDGTVLAVRSVALGEPVGDLSAGQIVVDDGAKKLSVATASTLIELTQLSSLEGEELPIEQLISDKQLRSGMVFDTPDSSMVEVLNTVGEAASKSTPHWLEALQAFSPYRLPQSENASSASAVEEASLVSQTFSLSGQSQLPSNLTPSEYLVGAWCTFLARASDTSQIDIGIGKTAQTLNEVYATAFSNWVPLATTVNATASVSASLDEIAKALNSISENGLIRRDLTGRNRDLQQRFTAGELSPDIMLFIDGSTATMPLLTESSAALVLNIRSEDSRMDFHFNPHKLSIKQVELLSQQFSHWCSTLPSCLTQSLNSIAILTAPERSKLGEFNDSEVDAMLGHVLPRLFDQSADEHASDIALLSGDAELTYGQLNEGANQLACFLFDKGIGRGDRVGVCLDRSIDLVVALLAVLKTGAAYIPIDPGFPSVRIQQMIDDANPALLITSIEIPDSISDWSDRCINVEEARSGNYTTKQLSRVSAQVIQSDDLAYIIYTSGSTGKPKGVEITHGSLCNFLLSMQQKPGCSATDRLLAVTTISFDIAVLELFLPLITGASVVIAQPDEIIDGQALLKLIQDRSVTMMQATPATWQLLLQSGWSDQQPVAKILCGGETLSSKLADQLLAHSDSVWNMYGPTETTIWSSCWQVEPDSSIVIGSPIANTQLYVLDSTLSLVASGFAGELYIGGAGVAQGYLNSPELNQSSFVDNPFNSGKLYRTGDLASFNSAGELCVLGRTDGQIKLRGYRIELGEVEAAVNAHDEIASSIVVGRNDRLIAYCVRNSSNQTDSAQNRRTQDTAVTQWRSLWDDAYEKHTDNPEFNLSGWHDSYNGQPFTNAQMRDWQRSSVDRILSYSPERVFEIGSGTGLILYAVAPHCRVYDAIDASQQAIEITQQHLSDLPQVSCEHRHAHELPDLNDKRYDTVIINSVAQYFPNHQYLVSALEWACQAVDKGRVFIGDVRNFSMLDVFHTDKVHFNAQEATSDNELKRQVVQSMRSERELLLSPEFFTALKTQIPEISRVDITLRNGNYLNEMTRYRYDVTLHIGTVEEPLQSQAHFQWSDISDNSKDSLSGMRELLNGSDAQQITVSNLPNGRLGDVHDRISHLLDSSPSCTKWIDPRQIQSLTTDTDYQVALMPSQSGNVWAFDATFWRSGEMPDLAFQTNGLVNNEDLARFANIPAAGLPNKQALNRFMPHWLTGLLPAFMLPDFFVELDEFPLTPNGKIDRNALPEPISQSAEPAAEPSNELEKHILAIWTEVLGHDQFGANDSFFQIGGNSLHVVQVQAALQQKLGRPIGTSTLYEFFTVKSLARHLSGDDSSQPKKTVRRRTADNDEAIAIIAMSCRLPGEINDHKDFWALLERGGDAIIDVPSDRWDADALYDPDPEAKGKSYCREGGFVYPIDQFDAKFFGVSPREARALDPSQRMILETSWEAFEQAGYTMEQLHGSQTGVFVGVGKGYHEYWLGSAGGLADLDGYYGTGSAGSTMSGRVSYSFGLEGPAMTVDTACSSSLVTTHQACNALRDGECDLALAAGITLLLAPDLHIEFSRLRGLSADGRCKSFSSGADGTGWSEGATVVVLKRLSDAQRDGNPIHAIIRGTSVNHAGHSASLTTPSGPAQQRVIRQALANSNLEPKDIDYIEAHGTGTRLGDPIEATSLAAVFGGAKTQDAPLWVGSVKSNLGHTQAAAGLAGVIKSVLAMQNNKLPRTLHCEKPTPSIDWEKEKIALVNEEQPWLRNGHARRAGISSFGIGGTNSHIIIEEAPPVHSTRERALASTPDTLPFVISGYTEEALRAQAEKLHLHLGMNIQDQFGDVAYSLATTRTHFRKRIAIVSRNKSDLLDALASFSRTGETPAGAARSATNDDTSLAMLFTGQGSQLIGMGKQLYETYPLFRESLDEIVKHFTELEQPLLDVMWADEGSDNAALLHRTDFTQPALFAIQVSLWRLWQSWGVQGDLLLGHSIGELAAAHAAEVFDLDDACRLVAARGRLMQALPVGGGMASVQATGAEVEQAIEQLKLSDTLGIAGLNAPQQTVVSGLEKSVDQLIEHFTAQERKAKKLQVSHAFHSYLMDDMLNEFRSVANTINYQAPQVSLISSVTGKAATAKEFTQAEYWVNQARQAVRFNDGMQTLADAGASVYLELGPQPILTGLGAICLADGGHDISWLPSLNRELDDSALIQRSLAELHVSGVSVDWSNFFAPFGTTRVPLPTYAFQRERHWMEQQPSRQVGAGLVNSNHALLGGSVEIAGTDMSVFATVVTADEPPWVREHQVMDAVLMPGTAFIEAMRVAGNKIDSNHWDLSEVIILSPLVLHSDDAMRLQITVGANVDNVRSVQVFSAPESEEADISWQLNAQGKLTIAESFDAKNQSLPPAGAKPMDVTTLYADLAELGYGYGPTFQGITEAFHVGGEVWAKVALPEAAESSATRYALHPALLDSAMHSLLLTQRLRDETSTDIFVPFGAERLSVQQEGLAQLWVRVASFEMGDGEFRASLEMYNTDGECIGRLDQLHAKRIDRAVLRRLAAAGVDRYQFNINWQSVEPQNPEPDGTWGLLSCGEVDWAEDLRSSLDDSGLQAIDVWELDEANFLDGLICLWDTNTEDTISNQAHEISHRALEQLQYLSVAEYQKPVIWLTRSSVGTSVDDPVSHLETSPLWGLIRTARNEYPDLSLRIVDIGESENNLDALMPALMLATEPECAIRNGQILIPQLARAASQEELVLPSEGSWQLEIKTKGRLDEPLSVKPIAEQSLAAGEIRASVKATGVNFLDVLNALGMVEIPAFGLEFSGVVTEVGANVNDLKVGDAVLGLAQGSFATDIVTDRRQVTLKPDNLSFEEAATIPMTFLTAWYGLHELGSINAGERVLIHAAAGGVGMAAVQLAQLQGAEVYATASEPKWAALRNMGLDDDHIASSRDLNFVEHFGKTAPGKSFDIVLNSLAKEFIDESLAMLGSNSRFLEMGKIDLREQSWIDEHHPGVTYKVYNLPEAGPDLMQEMLCSIGELFAAGKLAPLPLKTFPMNLASDALRYIAQAKHIGKVVLTPAKQQRLIDPEGAVLITGGVGGLGQFIARWLVTEHFVTDLVLTSRRGLSTPEAQDFVDELAELGANATVVACDAADYDALESVMALFNKQRPLRGIAHTAGVLDDGVLSAMTPERIDGVYSPKVDGAWNLHRLSSEMSLDFFVMFSSVSGVIGSLGQGNYAAANSFLDALAYHRRAKGLPASSIAWGAWDGQGMATHLSDADKSRFSRQGMDALAPAEGTELFHSAVMGGSPLTVAAAFDLSRMQRSFEEQFGASPALYRSIFRLNAAANNQHAGGGGGTDGGATLRKLLVAAEPEEYQGIMLQMIQEQVAKALEFSSPDDIDVTLGLQDIGVDSLMAVLMRNQLSDMTGLALPATIAFDHPNLKALGEYLLERVIELGIEARSQDGEEQAAETADTNTEHALPVNDGTLSSDVQFENAIYAAIKPESIFLTGPTGFVGAFLLNRLLSKNIVCHCLVRADDIEHGARRLRDTLINYGQWQDEFASLIHPVVGNLDQPLFGLSQHDFDELADSVDAICHAGAIVDWVMPLESYLDTNVAGTHEVLRLASCGRGKRIHYISTYATLPKHLGYHIPEDHIDYGYLTSKYMGEQLVTAAQWRGALASVYRLPFIGACSVTGQFRLDQGDFLHNLIAGCIDMGSFPALNGELRGLISVDYMADVISKVIVEDPDRIGKHYDFCNAKAPTFDEYADLVSATGCEVQTLPFEEWQSRALEQAKGDKTRSLARIAALVDHLSQSELEIMLRGYPVSKDVFGDELYPYPQVTVGSVNAYVNQINAH